MALENALAVMKLAGFVIEDAHAGAVVKTHSADAFCNRVPVGAGIAIDGRADRAGNSGESFQPLQAAVNSEIDQVLENSAALI